VLLSSVEGSSGKTSTWLLRVDRIVVDEIRLIDVAHEHRWLAASASNKRWERTATAPSWRLWKSGVVAAQDDPRPHGARDRACVVERPVGTGALGHLALVTRWPGELVELADGGAFGGEHEYLVTDVTVLEPVADHRDPGVDRHVAIHLAEMS
jgi:hypothetical protein